MRARHLAALVLALALAPPAGARADAIASDTADLSVTPSLGRGYTPAINAYHAVCFDQMPTTKASFDFDYSFEDVELDAVSVARRREALRTYEVDDFLQRNTQSRSVTTEKTTRYLHYMLAALVVDSYYSAIDEAHATISQDALTLLRKGDVVSFFTSCGTHYVRGISRRSYFLTLFRYATTDRRRDDSFELRVESEVRRVHGARPSKRDEVADGTFTDDARSRDLEIVTRSIGMVGQQSSTLLPFDLQTYEEAVKEAFKASQDEHTGRITALEIQPWLANPEILVLVGGVKYPDDAAVDWNERKRILSDNAEFYVELSRHLLDMTTQVHRAEACRQAVDNEAFTDHKLRPEYAGATIINQRTGERAPLTLLLDAISDANIDRMRAIGLAIRGGADGKSGAAACMAELERTNLGGRFHNDIPSCNWSREPLPGARVIQDFCPPQIERHGGSDAAAPPAR